MVNCRPFAVAPAIALLAISAPAHATGGFVCSTASGPETQISLGFGHVPGAPLIATRYVRDGREVAVNAVQWWFDGRELRLHLTDPEAMRTLAILKAKAMDNPQMNFDGQLKEGDRTRWIRCKEG